MPKFKQFILLEMPQHFHSGDDIAVNDPKANYAITQSYKQTHINIDTIQFQNDEIDVYYDGNKSGGDYAFISGDKTIAEYSYGAHDSGFIQTDTIWQDKAYRGIFRFIFVTYLLPKYKTIISDHRLTQLGFNFWVKLFNDYNSKFQFGIFNMDSNETIKIDSGEEFKKYYSELEEMKKWRFYVML